MIAIKDGKFRVLRGVAMACAFALLVLGHRGRTAAAQEKAAPAVETPAAGQKGSQGTAPVQAPPVEATPAPAERSQLSLAQTIERALRSNLNIRIIGYRPRVAATAIDSQASVFDPVFSTSLSYVSNEPPLLESTTFSSTNHTPSLSHNWTRTNVEGVVYDAGVSVKSTAGGRLGLSTGVARNDITTSRVSRDPVNEVISKQFEDYYSGNITLQFSQPLLKNAGATVNKASLSIVLNDAKGSTCAFEDQVMDLVLNTSISYWHLVFAREDLKAKEKSLQAAQDLLKNNTVKYEAGTLAKVEVTRARARVAEREEAVVTAKAVIKDAEDGLRGILDSPDFAVLSSAEIIPTDQPAVYAEQLDVAAAVHMALATRPDIREQLLRIENSGIRLAFTKHQLLPQVDFQATYKLNSFGDSWTENVEAARRIDKRDLTLGITFSRALGNRSARSDYARNRYERFQELAALELLKRQVALDVKKAIRDVATSLQRIDTNQLRRQYAQEYLEAEIQKYEVGQSINLDVLAAQETLQQAESAYVQSVVGFNQAMVTYYRASGQILRKCGIEVVGLATVKKGSETLSQ